VTETPWHVRLATFLRTVIPADPQQLIFLTGIVCLIVASRLSWLPPEEVLDRYHPYSSDLYQLRFDAKIFLIYSSMFSLFSGFAGYFACFWPGVNPLRRVAGWVLLPAAAGVLLDVGRLVYLNSQFTSGLNHTVLVVVPSFSQLKLWTAAPGFHFALVGTILVSWFSSKIWRGTVSLPLTLPGAPTEEPTGPERLHRTQLLIWVLLGPLLFAATIPSGMVFMMPVVSSRLSMYLSTVLFKQMSSAVESLLYLGVMYWIGGAAFGKAVRAWLRLSRPLFFLAAAAMPVTIATIVSTGSYFFDRVTWAANEFGKLVAPVFGAYFAIPDPWLLLMFFGALFEELVFRGFLRETLVVRYGLFRGIFLTGMVWAAYHFHSDANFNRTDQGMLLQLGFRIAVCLALNSVFCWLTLKSGSVLPSAVSHGLYNVLVVGGLGPEFPGKPEAQIALWGVLALILFKYFPIQMPTSQDAATDGAAPEPAT
jgi:membrane protease YdiL (CAAX protease family)